MKAIALISLLSTATAATIRIDVGKSGLTFSPDSVTAKTGDVLEYHFHGPVPHSVAQSDLGSPCNPSKTGGFYSGTIRTNGNGENTNVFSVKVNSTTPIFFYCAIQGHCESGMVGVVNPSSSETLDAYKNAAQSANTVAPANVFGGVLGPASSGDDSSSSSTTTPTGTGTGTGTSSTTSPTGGNSASGGSGGGNGNSGSALGASVLAVVGGMFGVAALLI